VNPFDLGVRGNLKEFFNTGRVGRWGWYTVFIPLKIPPASDGWSWPKRPGWENQVLPLAEELTDEEDEEDGAEGAQPSRSR
jgi:palmitoyltransferase